MDVRAALKRSVLYTPASRVDRVAKALTKGDADVVVADLEDGTAPSERAAARAALKELLASPPVSRSVWAVRVNALATMDHDADVDAVRPHPPPLIVVPKVEDAGALTVFLARLSRWRPVPLVMAQIETAKGLLHADKICAVDGVVAVIFGSEDYAADVGATRTPEAQEVLYARSHVVAAAAAARIDAIDQIWADFKDVEGLRRDAAFGAQLGFAGKQLIHPDQIAPTHEAFRPSPSELDRARRIVAASEAAGGGVVVVDGRMIDRPLVEQARRVLRRGGV